MFILGSLNSNKTDILTEKYISLLKQGIESKNILFLTLNAYKRNLVIHKIKLQIKDFKDTKNIQTYLRLAHTSITENWAEIQEQIQTGLNTPKPTLCGLEISQNILSEAVKRVGFKDYNSKINLIHQLLRRNSLIINNNLSNLEIEEKSKILAESFKDDAKHALEIYKAKTLEYRSFDYMRQLEIFKYVYKNLDYLKNIEYLLVDDLDEQTVACVDFIEYLKPQLKEFYIAVDEIGSSRYGYLCADLECKRIISNTDKKIQADETTNSLANDIFNAVKNDSIIDSPDKLSTKGFNKRLEMLNNCIEQIKQLLNSNAKFSDISIITPVFDNQLKFTLTNEFEKLNIKYKFISGSEKLVDNNLVSATLKLLKFINQCSNKQNSENIQDIFANILKIPVRHSIFIIKSFIKNNEFPILDFSDSDYNSQYTNFLKLINNDISDLKLSEQMDYIYNSFLKTITKEEYQKYNFLKKQIIDFENTFKHTLLKEKIVEQLSNSIISENDILDENSLLTDNEIIISTPQKVIDYELKKKYQILLDISDDEWIKQDSGTIYNAWVFQKNWTKNTFSYEDSIECIKEKTARILRKLALLTQNKIIALSSQYNSLGFENNIGISKYLSKTVEKQDTSRKPFIPRNDQKEILNYQSGQLAITAVPGAGKTTIIKALTGKLIENKISPDNIFVLTYMDSAAKNIKEKLLNDYPNLKTYPNITTIHSLALRIIKENGNYAKLNLDANFDVCDDTIRQKIITELLGELHLKYDEYEKYEKGLSIIKFVNTNINRNIRDKELKDFLTFYKHYQLKLNENNLIDYDDMLISSVNLLENNPEILNYYQNIVKILIEDEAQDSSAIQQKLISLLVQKNKNLIRCGDVNQCITTTFTNADVSGFRKFIESNKSIKMNKSQRCSKEIYDLANQLIEESQNIENAQKTFFPIKIEDVKGKNPTTKNCVYFQKFENSPTEKEFIIHKIHEIFKISQNSTIAILLRNNFQVSEYSEILRKNGLKIISKIDRLADSKIFNIIISILEFTLIPWNTENILKIYDNIFDKKINDTMLNLITSDFIKNSPTELENEELIKLHWELNYWLNNAAKNEEDLALEIGLYYAENETDKANLFIIAEIIRRISKITNSKTELIDKLKQISQKPTISGLKLLIEDENTLENTLGGKVQIMTVHKSKGDEFDYVFIPEFTENNYPSRLKSVKVGDYQSFYESLKSLDKHYKSKNLLLTKQENLEENLRLIYVGITRAKKGLFFTVAQTYKKFGKEKKSEISKIFEILENCYIKKS